MRDDEFVSYLKDVHSGVQSCVSGAVLAKTFRVSENELRRRVNRLRRKGNPIVIRNLFLSETGLEKH